MSTPLFEREPIIASAAVVGDEVPVALPVGPADATETAEATLIETILCVAQATPSDAGLIRVYVTPPYPGTDKLVAEEVIDAAGGTARAKKTITLNLCLPVGWGLKVAHDVESGMIDVTLDCSAVGGIVR